jgi:SAM-dependent methyltransferase
MSPNESAYKIPEKMYRKFPDEGKQLLESIVRFIGPKIGETIVDVGTGAGFLAVGLSEKVGRSGKVIGLDVSKSALQQARRKAAKENPHQVLEFKVGDVYSLPLQDNFADVVCCKSLIASLDHRQKAVREMARVARHGGRVVVAEPGELVGLPSRIKKAFYEAIVRRPLNERNVKNLFKSAGLRSIEVVTSEPPIVTDASIFEWTTENLFGDSSLWELAVEGGAVEEQVRSVHEDILRQVKKGGVKFGTGAIFGRGTKP